MPSAAGGCELRLEGVDDEDAAVVVRTVTAGAVSALLARLVGAAGWLGVGVTCRRAGPACDCGDVGLYDAGWYASGRTAVAPWPVES